MARQLNRRINVMRFEPNYPKRNPNPLRVVSIPGSIPQNLQIKFLARYAAPTVEMDDREIGAKSSTCRQWAHRMGRPFSHSAPRAESPAEPVQTDERTPDACGHDCQNPLPALRLR
jgi:hypothetical protein